MIHKKKIIKIEAPKNQTNFIASVIPSDQNIISKDKDKNKIKATS